MAIKHNLIGTSESKGSGNLMQAEGPSYAIMVRFFFYFERGRVLNDGF